MPNKRTRRRPRKPCDLPAELTRREKRLPALKQARQVIEARAKEMAAAQVEPDQAKVAARQAQRDAGQKPRGKEPAPPSAVPEPKAQYNFTDPESRIMKAGNGQHFEQAYNAQAAVDEAMLIVGERVSDAPNDKQELPANVAAISPVVAAEVRAVLVDSGFYSAAAVAAVEQKPDGTASGLTVYAAVEKTSHHKTVADLLPQPEPPAPGPGATAKERMAHRLKTAVGQALYRLRKQTVEPVFGIIKEGDGVPALPVARAGEGCAGMDVGLRELQSQTTVHAQKPGGGGIKRGAAVLPAKNPEPPPSAWPSCGAVSKFGFVSATGGRHWNAPPNVISKSDKFLVFGEVCSGYFFVVFFAPQIIWKERATGPTP